MKTTGTIRNYDLPFRFLPRAVQAPPQQIDCGFYRTCVMDDVLEHSPAEHVRHPTMSPESPAPGFAHLQFEAMLTAARDSTRVPL